MSLHTQYLEQQHSDQGSDVRFSKTLKQGRATHGPADQVARGKGQIFKQELRFLKGIAMAGLRVNRYFVKFDDF